MTTVVALGLLSGLAAGPILSLPARVLEPDTRAIGMGLFFSISYIGLVLGPTLGGKYATWAGSAGAAFDPGGRGPLDLSGHAVDVSTLSERSQIARAGVVLTGLRPNRSRRKGTQDPTSWWCL